MLKLLRTFLVCGINTFSHLFFAVGIHVHVREDPGLVGPQVVIGAKEVNGKLADIVPHPLDVLGNGFGMADFCWPPPSRAGEEEKPEERNQTSACAGGLCKSRARLFKVAELNGFTYLLRITDTVHFIGAKMIA